MKVVKKPKWCGAEINTAYARTIVSELFLDGQTVREISEALEITTATTYRWLNEAGHKLQNSGAKPTFDYAEAARLLRTGQYTRQQLADKLGVQRNTLDQAMWKKGARSGRKSTPRFDHEAALAALRTGEDTKMVAARYGIGAQYLRHMARKAGIEAIRKHKVDYEHVVELYGSGLNIIQCGVRLGIDPSQVWRIVKRQAPHLLRSKKWNKNEQTADSRTALPS